MSKLSRSALLIAIAVILASSLLLIYRASPIFGNSFVTSGPKFFYSAGNYWLDFRNGTIYLMHEAFVCPPNRGGKCSYDTVAWYPQWLGTFWVDYKNGTKVGFGYWTKYKCTSTNVTAPSIVSSCSILPATRSEIPKFNQTQAVRMEGGLQTNTVTTVTQNSTDDSSFWDFWYLFWGSNNGGYYYNPSFYSSPSFMPPSEVVPPTNEATSGSGDGDPSDGAVVGEGDSDSAAPSSAPAGALSDSGASSDSGSGGTSGSDGGSDSGGGGSDGGGSGGGSGGSDAIWLSHGFLFG
jgi:uncharacterized membrane protein YgcG